MLKTIGSYTKIDHIHSDMPVKVHASMTSGCDTRLWVWIIVNFCSLCHSAQSGVLQAALHILGSFTVPGRISHQVHSQRRGLDILRQVDNLQQAIPFRACMSHSVTLLHNLQPLHAEVCKSRVTTGVQGNGTQCNHTMIIIAPLQAVVHPVLHSWLTHQQSGTC